MELLLRPEQFFPDSIKNDRINYVFFTIINYWIADHNYKVLDIASKRIQKLWIRISGFHRGFKLIKPNLSDDQKFFLDTRPPILFRQRHVCVPNPYDGVSNITCPHTPKRFGKIYDNYFSYCFCNSPNGYQYIRAFESNHVPIFEIFTILAKDKILPKTRYVLMNFLKLRYFK